nr:MAG TPA: hypothetical protein [Caudoviricetes sp.]
MYLFTILSITHLNLSLLSFLTKAFTIRLLFIILTNMAEFYTDIKSLKMNFQRLYPT